MTGSPIKQVSGKGVYVPGDDIDTDRIIPARFMKCVTFDGLGDCLFYDVRKTETGKNKEHNLNDPRFANATILLSGNNFGCGSSREHAPQSILRAGFKAVIAGSFAEIFFGNSTNLGIVCVAASDENRAEIAKLIEAQPDIEITIDLENQIIRLGGTKVPCSIKQEARDSLLRGTYDPFDELIEGAEEVAAVAGKLAYMRV